MITAKEQNGMIDEISGYCKKLFFTAAIPEKCQTDGTPKQIEYLRDALKQEIESREINHIQRLIKRARFPVYKTFDGYDFGQTRLPPALAKDDLMNVSFIEKKQNLVLYGQVGLGKTHMAIAAGVLACRKGYNLDSRVNMTRLVPLSRELYIFQPAC